MRSIRLMDFARPEAMSATVKIHQTAPMYTPDFVRPS